MKKEKSRKGAILLAVFLLCSGCAFSRYIPPSAISPVRYDGWECPKLRAEQVFIEESLTQVITDLDYGVVLDIVKADKVGQLKGEQISIHQAIVDAGCT